jgi:predicted AlkP superfamily pyrophosphatase or phosphodiesterase
MQTSVPELMEIDGEPEFIHRMYGTEPGKLSFANNCLLARRMIERGVRFVQLYHWGWDQHGDNMGNDIRMGLERQTRQTDRACAALIRDLKQRGLLEDTLVVWGGEFGRTPMNEERNGSKWLGRDHHPHAFTIWMAGGGMKPGLTYGETDELGYHVVRDRVHVHDLQATILHCLGLDHERLTHRFQGRDFRLTDVHGRVVKELLA